MSCQDWNDWKSIAFEAIAHISFFIFYFFPLPDQPLAEAHAASVSSGGTSFAAPHAAGVAAQILALTEARQGGFLKRKLCYTEIAQCIRRPFCWMIDASFPVKSFNTVTGTFFLESFRERVLLSMLLCTGPSSPSHLWPHLPCIEVNISAMVPHRDAWQRCMT